MNPETLAALAAALAAALEASPADVAHLAVYGSLPSTWPRPSKSSPRRKWRNEHHPSAQRGPYRCSLGPGPVAFVFNFQYTENQ